MVSNNVPLNSDDITMVLPEEKLKWCTIKINEIIEKDFRVDAGVFSIEAKHAYEIVQNNSLGYVRLLGEDGLIEEAFYPNRFKRIYVEKEYGEEFYLPSQINEINPKPSKFISSKTKCNLEELKLKEKTLLLTRSGTIGNCTIVSETLKNKIFSDDVIRIKFKDDIDLGYVYAFMKTKVGLALIRNNQYGSVVSHVEPEHLKEVIIPNADIEFKNKINELIVNSFKCRDESNEMIELAKRILIKELELNDISEDLKFESEVNCFQVSLNTLNIRFDSSYHIPVNQNIINNINKEKCEIIKLGDKRLSKNITLPGRFKRVYVEEGQGTLFFGGKQIYELAPNSDKFLSTNKHGKRISDELEIRENMVLITRSGTIGKVTLAPKHWENWVVNEHVIRVIPADDSVVGYIYAFLDTDYGLEFIKKFTYGSVVDEIDTTHVSEINIPVIKDREKFKIINDLVLNANLKRTEAYNLQSKAINKINNELLSI